jgi:hypothetical protein
MMFGCHCSAKRANFSVILIHSTSSPAVFHAIERLTPAARDLLLGALGFARRATMTAARRSRDSRLYSIASRPAVSSIAGSFGNPPYCGKTNIAVFATHEMYSATTQ